MSTTTIRLPDKLKARIARAAGQAGKTTHGFILEAIAEKADNTERREKFHTEAERRYAALIASGKTIAWPEMRGYLEKRMAGKSPKRPVARKKTA
jgi:predicted transcriptional regulator